MAEGAVIASEYGAKIIDINMGCPVPKVVKNGEGSALMQNPPLACDIVSAMKKAVKYIFGEINGSVGFLIASKLAEEYKLTRSVIVNALRKLESAGVIDARSLGMKGTYIKVLNDYLYEELAKV